MQDFEKSMKNIFSVPDWLSEFSGDPLPFSFSEKERFDEIDSLRDNFMDQARRESFENLEPECYDKHSPGISGDEQFNDRGFSRSFAFQMEKESYNSSPLVTAAEDQPKSHALQKVAWTVLPSTNKDYDNSSVVSQASEEGTQGLNTKDSPEDSRSLEETTCQHKDSPKPQAATKDSSDNFDEGSLVFLIRKVDRKTKKSRLLTKHRKKITKCEHKHLEYYAKGMCKNCYHSKGKRSKKATKCEHTDRDHYAKGLCKNCYLHFFHLKKKLRKSQAACKQPSI